MKKIIISGVACLLLASQAQARDLGNILKECGIGAAIFNDNRTAAAISNLIWDLGTTATSSDMSSPEECKGSSAKVAILIGSSYDKLENEIAKGNGKYLKTLATLSNKSTTEIRNKFAKVVASKDFDKLSKEEKAQKLYDIASK